MIIGFTMTCSKKTLVKRHEKRGDNNEVSFEWLRLEHYPNDYVINTDNKSVTQMLIIVDVPYLHINTISQQILNL